MAESVEGQDDILKCPICLEILNKPKYLPCLHTFCEHCLQSYITSTVKENDDSGAETKVDNGEDVKTKVDDEGEAATNLNGGEEAKSKVSDETEGKTKENEEEAKTRPDESRAAEFSCPFCRVIVLVPDSKSPVEEWASQFPNNHLIMTLLDTKKLQAKAKMCDPCQMDGNDITAESWCKICNEALCGVCAKYHRKMLALQHHKLFLIADQEKNDFEITRLEFCENHKDKQLEAFCFDHNQACCVSCITIGHRKCDQVSSLADAARDIVNKPELAQLREKMLESEKLLSAILKISKDNLSELRTKKVSMLTEVSDLRKKIDNHFDDIQGRLAQDIKDLEKQLATDINDVVFHVENQQKSASSYGKVYDAVVSKATDIHIFLEMKRLENKQSEMEEYLKRSLKTIKRVDYTVEFTPEIQENILLLDRFGSVDVQKKGIVKEVIGVSCVDHVPSLFKRMGLGAEFSLYSSFAVPETNICGCVFLPNGKLAITYGSHEVRFCQDNGSDMKLFDLEISGPVLHGLGVLNDNEILVSRPSLSSIHKVNFHNRISKKTFQPSVDCKGLSVLDKYVVMACGSKLVFMDFNGCITKSVGVKPPVDNVTSFNKNIYYTNSKDRALYGINFDGKNLLKYTHRDLKEPRGVTTDEDGNIFVAGHGSSNVHQVSPEGRCIGISLTEKEGIVNPNAICYDKTTNRLMVSHSKNKIGVFKRTW